MQQSPAIFLRSLISEAEKTFPSNDISIRRYEAERIITHILNIQRIDIYTNPKIDILEEQKKQIKALFQKRVNSEPLQYILGYENFRNLELNVGPGVLIPRPETELIVEYALRLLPAETPKVLDIGTGSGAIALSIAYESPITQVTAVDISLDALKYAKINKEKNNIKNIRIFENNLCDNFSPSSFDIIIANLPYVTEDEYLELDDEVKNFEPKTALTAGEDGLDLIRRLIPQAYKTLKSSGWLLLEIGYQQSNNVEKLLKENNFTNIETIPDFNNKDRIVKGQKI